MKVLACWHCQTFGREGCATFGKSAGLKPCACPRCQCTACGKQAKTHGGFCDTCDAYLQASEAHGS